MWGKASFHKRVAKMRAKGVTRVVAPDFSSWADMPLVAQLYNYYRSMVVTCDLVQAGFQVVPNVCWSAPQLFPLCARLWPDTYPAVLVDGNHVETMSGVTYNRELFWRGALAVVKSGVRARRTLVWSSVPRVAVERRHAVGGDGGRRSIVRSLSGAGVASTGARPVVR